MEIQRKNDINSKKKTELHFQKKKKKKKKNRRKKKLGRR